MTSEVTTDDIVISNPATLDPEIDCTEVGADQASAADGHSEGRVSQLSSTTVQYSANNNADSEVPKAPQVSAYEMSLQQWRDRQKPVKERNLKLYKIISVIAIITFFPLGIPSLWNSYKLEEEYYEGIERGDLAKCNKRVLLLNKLLILSFTMCFFTVILILAIYGGVKGGDGYVSFAQAHLY